mmetsp:Transcript_4602/g.6793  ORF Transcript_4602/g.6793 Transcript_4602/m.6793 type:complete len:663 (+) Transcript_4602:91-2079(+)
MSRSVGNKSNHYASNNDSEMDHLDMANTSDFANLLASEQSNTNLRGGISSMRDESVGSNRNSLFRNNSSSSLRALAALSTRPPTKSQSLDKRFQQRLMNSAQRNVLSQNENLLLCGVDDDNTHDEKKNNKDTHSAGTIPNPYGGESSSGPLVNTSDFSNSLAFVGTHKTLPYYLDELTTNSFAPQRWAPTKNKLEDMLHFCGPGWLIAIAYIDSGAFQADIRSGATSQYRLMFVAFWTTIMAMFIQILSVRLAYYGQVTLAEAQARDVVSNLLNYINWFIAEVTIILADLPQVMGMGIALHIFFGWPYYYGILISPISTMILLGSVQSGMRVLESVVCVFLGVTALAIWVEMGLVGVDGPELAKGLFAGFTELEKSDVFGITGLLGAIAMPHNLYLHTATLQSRPVKRKERIVRQAVKYSCLEPILPLTVAFLVNIALISIAAESIHGTEDADHVGLAGFCNFFKSVKGGCAFWGFALLASAQSSCITTTFAGQYVMDGFLNLKLRFEIRSILTRLAAIIPCLILSIMFPTGYELNHAVNIVNSLLSFLLPFALTPLVKFNCDNRYMGKYAAKGSVRTLLYAFATLVWGFNAYALSSVGGGLFGSFVQSMEKSVGKVACIVLEVVIQLLYLGWNWHCLTTPVSEAMTPLEVERPYDDQFAIL